MTQNRFKEVERDLSSLILYFSSTLAFAFRTSKAQSFNNTINTLHLNN
jgi:hypothetical protein